MSKKARSTKRSNTQQKNSTSTRRRTQPASPATDYANVRHALERPESVTPSDLLAMQRTFGNQAVGTIIQPKLTVGPVSDTYEREANEVAERVLATPTSSQPAQRQEDEDEVQRTPLAASITPLVQREAVEEEEPIQAKRPAERSNADGSFTVGDDIKQRLQRSKGAGTPLPNETRAFMEPRFGTDFGSVRVHTDTEAQKLNTALNAKAFTHGRDIYFGAGTFNPGTTAGKRLLAHELTHVIQQTGGAGVQRVPKDTIQRKFGDSVRYAFRSKKKREKAQNTPGKDKLVRAGGKGAQEARINTIMAPEEQREQRLDELLESAKLNTLHNFNKIAELLAGGIRSEKKAEYKAKIQKIFGTRRHRTQYLLDMLEHGEPSAESKAALRMGLLTSDRAGATTLTFGRGSGHRNDIIRLANELTAQELESVLTNLGDKIRKKFGSKTYDRLQSRLGAKRAEDQLAGETDPQKKQFMETQVLNAYDQELRDMVRRRAGKMRTKKTKLFNELQNWAKHKDPKIVEKIIDNPDSLFRKRLKKAVSSADVDYVLKLMRAPEVGVGEEADDAAGLQQVGAILDRQHGRWRFTRWRQKGGIKQRVANIFEGMEDPQTAVVAHYINKTGGAEDEIEKWKSGDDREWQTTILQNALNELRREMEQAGLKPRHISSIMNTLRYGKAAGGTYDKLKKRATERRPRVRRGRSMLDMIQQIEPGSSEFELIRQDKALLRDIRRRSTKSEWKKVKGIFGITDEYLESGGLASFKKANELEQEASQTWEGQGGLDRAQKWASLLDAELSSVAVNEDTVFKHVFNAQKDAWAYATAEAEKDDSLTPEGIYRQFMQAIKASMKIKIGSLKTRTIGSEVGRYALATATVGTSLFFTGTKDRGHQQTKRLEEALDGDYDNRLRVGDLLNVARRRGGQRRTNTEMIKFAINSLSAQQLLDEWSNFEALKEQWEPIRRDRETLDQIRDEIQTLEDEIGTLHAQLAQLEIQSSREYDVSNPSNPQGTQQEMQEQLRDKTEEVTDKKEDAEELADRIGPAQAQFRQAFTLKVREEFWDQKLQNLGSFFSGKQFGEFAGKDEQGKPKHVSLRDLLKRDERIEIERMLLNRLAEEADKAPQFQQLAAEVMNVEETDEGDQGTSAKHLAMRTKAIGDMETARMLASGNQWTDFSAKSLVYKEAQRGFMKEFRTSERDIDTSEREGGQSRLAAIKGKTGEIEQAEQTLQTEEEEFRALREKYTRRLTTIVTIIVTTLLTSLSIALTSGWSAGPGVAMLIAGISSLIASAISTAVERSTQGYTFSWTDKIRNSFVNLVVDSVGGLMGNLALGIKSIGAEAIYSPNANPAAKLFGKPALDMLAAWGANLGTDILTAPVQALNRFAESSSITETFDKAKHEFAEQFKNLPKAKLNEYLRRLAMTGGMMLTNTIASGAGMETPLTGQRDIPTGDEGNYQGTSNEGKDVLNPFGTDGNPFGVFTGGGGGIADVNNIDFGNGLIEYGEASGPLGFGQLSGMEFDWEGYFGSDGAAWDLSNPQSLANQMLIAGWDLTGGQAIGQTFDKASSAVQNSNATLTETKKAGTVKEAGEGSTSGSGGFNKEQLKSSMQPMLVQAALQRAMQSSSGGDNDQIDPNQLKQAVTQEVDAMREAIDTLFNDREFVAQLTGVQ